jgi:hypothetical protein
MFSKFMTASVLSMSAAAMLLPGATSAQAPRYGYEQGQGNAWNGTTFWQGAPNDPRQRIDWLQRRIDRGIADRSLDRREARNAQQELNTIRRMTRGMRMRNGVLYPRDAAIVQQRLDALSQRLRWDRQNAGYGNTRGNSYGNAAPYGRDQFATDYDAAPAYRDDPRYTERRLSSQDEVYRGSDGRYYCKRNDGTTGLIIGGIGGGVLGNVVDGGHNRAAGTLIGGALGALAGKAIEQNGDVRCR